MFRVGQSFKYKNDGTIIYTVSKVYNDGAILARDNEGDEFSFETEEFDLLEKVKQ